MLELVPALGSSRRYRVRRDGHDVAQFTLAWLREAGRLHIDGIAHELRREGLVSGAFTLSCQGMPVASARKPSALRNRFEVEYEGRQYEVVRAAWWGRRYEVRAHGQPIGSIGPHHPFTRRAEIALPDELTLPVKVFVAALVVLLWNRDSSGAAGGGGS